MKKIVLLFALGFLCVINQAFTQQGVLDPNDPLVNYDASNPPEMPQPNTLAKWVRTPRPEMPFSTDRFKSYIFNGMSFRLRFPNGYDPSNTEKKYPVILFFHGIGEIAPVTDNEMQLYWGAQKFENMINEGQFDAFLFFPTTRVGDWSPSFPDVNMVLDLLQQYCNTDPDKLITMGLSLGGDGAMKYTFDFPKRSAISIASSPGSVPTFINNNPANYLHVPFWISTGEFDEFSPPPTVQAYVNNFRSAGGDIRWTLFPNKGHGTWVEHWEEPYLVPYWNSTHKANPLVFNQQTQFPVNTPVNARIGITAGFAQYEWQKDNVTIEGANSNEIVATAPGSYRVRFMREGSPNWSDWSLNPAVISQAATPPDNSPPSVPENLQIVSVTANAVTLNWDDATDNTGVTGYEVYGDGNLIATTGGSEFTVENLSPNTSYSFTVLARDQAGNASASSAAVTGTTSALPDNNPPSVPENLQVVSVSETAISLNWDDAWDNTGVNGYDVFVDDNLIATTGSSEFTAENLSPNTSYSFTLVARDQAGNASGFSSAITATTSEEGSFILSNRIRDINDQKMDKEIIAISGAYPNPFIESFNISIDNPAAGNKINAGIYDLAGKLVYNKYFGNIAAGRTVLRMTTGNKQLLPGVYFVRLEVNGKPSKILKLMKR